MKFLDEIGLRHFANRIKELFNKKADKAYVDNKVKADVPANAKFTDTTYDLAPYMKKDGDILGIHTEKLVTIGGTGIINLNEGNVFVDNPTSNRNYMITGAKSGTAHSFTLQINMKAVRSISFPSNVKWQGEEPDLTEANKEYLLAFMTIDGGDTWLGWSKSSSSGGSGGGSTIISTTKPTDGADMWYEVI